MTKTIRSAAALAALASVSAFANADAAAATTPAAKAKGGAPKAEDRVAPVFTTVRTDIPLPEGKTRGSKSELAAKLEELTVGASIGLTNKTKRQVSSAVSKANNAASNQRPKLDATGAQVMKTGPAIKDAAGNHVGYGPSVPETEKVKEFVAHDMDPKKDPEKATVRIFRVK